MPTDYMTTESRLPFSLEAEQSVLGAALLDSGCISELVRLVRPEYFYREQHRRIFEVISNKFTMGEPIDIVTVTEAAVRRRSSPRRRRPRRIWRSWRSLSPRCIISRRIPVF